VPYYMYSELGREKNSSPPRGSNSQPSDHTQICVLHACRKSLTLYPIELGGRCSRFARSIYDPQPPNLISWVRVVYFANDDPPNPVHPLSTKAGSGDGNYESRGCDISMTSVDI
jgi:hypothetical protein